MPRLTNHDKIKKIVSHLKSWFNSDKPMIEHYNDNAFKFYAWKCLIRYYPEFESEILKESKMDFYLNNKFNLYLSTDELFDLLYKMNASQDAKEIRDYIKNFIIKNNQSAMVYELSHVN